MGKANGVRILFAAPAWAPSRAFGGPVVAAGELVRRLVAHGHAVDVLTTTIVDLEQYPSPRSRLGVIDGATVHYLGTPLRYRWMGITPTLPVALARLKRPDVVHVFGFRDPVTTGVAAWCRLAGVPYVFEPLGMFQPRLRKVAFKRLLDATLYRSVARGAAAVVVASEREREDVIGGGVPAEKVIVRGNGFPEPTGPAGTVPGHVREDLEIPPEAPLILYVGRVAAGKGIEHLLAAVHALPDAHLVIAGPDDRHGISTDGERVHRLPLSEEPPGGLYPQADVFVLASEGESFGMVAAEAAACGVLPIVADHSGLAEVAAGLGENGLTFDGTASDLEARLAGVLALPDARRREMGLAARAAVVERWSWDGIAQRLIDVSLS